MPGESGSARVPLLRVDGLSFAYGGALAVNGVSFELAKGTALALLGANGAGKSTTVKLIAGVLRAQTGRVMLDGSETTALPSHEIVHRGITLVPEGRLVFPRLTVLDNLKMGAYTKRAEAKFQHNLEGVETLFPRLAERRFQLAGSMSGGEQQMLAIARGMMSDPRVMILDEPSLGLMPSMVDQLFELIATIRSTGVSLIVVEQNAFQTLEIVDRALVLEKGEVTLEGTGQELLGSDYVRKAFLGL